MKCIVGYRNMCSNCSRSSGCTTHTYRKSERIFIFMYLGRDCRLSAVGFHFRIASILKIISNKCYLSVHGPRERTDVSRSPRPPHALLNAIHLPHAPSPAFIISPITFAFRAFEFHIPFLPRVRFHFSFR